jgi:tetratricopeptide (TPR) repeat protein
MMERNVEQMRQVANKSEESTAAGFVSALFGYMGEFEKALSYSDRSIKLAQDLKNPYAEAASFHYRGIIRDQQGQWDSAVTDYATAQRIAEKAGDMFRVYIVKFMEGRAFHMTGDQARGRKLIENSISLATQIKTTFLLGQAKSFLAACCLADGCVEEAVSLCTDGISLATKAGDKFTETLALRTLAESLCQRGSLQDRNQARRTLLDAIELLEGIRARPELARCYASLACILKTEGNAPEATNYLEKAMRQFGDLGMSWDITRATRAFEHGAVLFT